jgi:hypothetical protein
MAVAATERGVEGDLDEVAGRTVRQRVAAVREHRLTVDVSVRGTGIEREAGDLVIRQARKLAGIADAVVVQVLPDGELREGLVVGIDLAVMVAVERRQRGQAIDIGAAGKVRREDLAAIVDRPVAIHVIGQDAIGARGPGDLVLVTVGVDVEGDTVVECGQGNAVVVEVEDDGVAVRLHVIETCKLVRIAWNCRTSLMLSRSRWSKRRPAGSRHRRSASKIKC